jgi:hypothetical protein
LDLLQEWRSKQAGELPGEAELSRRLACPESMLDFLVNFVSRLVCLIRLLLFVIVSNEQGVRLGKTILARPGSSSWEASVNLTMTERWLSIETISTHIGVSSETIGRQAHRTNDYRTKRTILEIYDALAEAIKTGKPYQTRLDPPPADPLCCHPARA